MNRLAPEERAASFIFSVKAIRSGRDASDRRRQEGRQPRQIGIKTACYAT